MQAGRRNFVGGLAAVAATGALAPAHAQRRGAERLATTIEAVQMPAWVERGGQRQPLAPGDAVSSADELRTGPQAGVVMRMAEGSLVRLGENSRLGLPGLEASDRDGRIRVEADLRLFDGFFRFATSAVSKAIGERRIEVGLRTATIGIRGTDFWSMTDAEHDAACVFEGRIDLATRDQGALTLDQPTAFWARFFERPVQPVGQATPQQLNTFLNSTELTPGRGIALAGGGWRVVALTTRDARRAMAVGGRLRAQGFPARVLARGGEHVAQIGQLASQADAQAVAQKIAGVDGVEPRVDRMA